MVNKLAVVLIGALSVVACDQMSSPSSPSSTTVAASVLPSSASAQANGESRVGFGFNGTVSGFPTGQVFLTGGGAFNSTSNFVNAGGGFRCLADVLQGPLSTSVNLADPGPCRAGEGVRWDTAALLPGTTFKCTGAASEALKTAVTNDRTVVLQANFYRASNGDDQSFVAKIIVSDGDIATDFPGVNLWVQGVGCGTAQTVNFSR